MLKRYSLRKTVKELQNVKLNQFPKYRLTGEYVAKVVKVYDGDTITVVFKTGKKDPFYQWSVRMYGYDSPELRPSKKKDYSESRFKDRNDEVYYAKQARDHLAELVLDKLVLLQIIPNEDDKFGRLLCNVFHYPIQNEKNCVNAEMINAGHGYEYFGGTKRD